METEEIQANENQGLSTVNQFEGVNLYEDLQESSVDLSSDYWTPKDVGELKRGVLSSIENSVYKNEDTGEEIQLPCIILLEQTEDGQLRRIRNGSKRLVATLENAISVGNIILNKTPIQIKYLGKEKNKNNSFFSDRWSVVPLQLKK